MSALRQLLLDTASLYRDLEDGLQGTRTGDGGDRTTGGSVEVPLPLDTRVADHRHLLVQGLRYWVNRTRTPGAPGHAMHRVPAMVAVLVHRLPTMDVADETELESNLRDWQRGARGRMDLPKLRTTVPLPTGTCPNRTEVDGQTVYACPGALTVMVPADAGTPPWLQCRDCKTRLQVTELPDAANVRLPLAVAAELTGIPLSTIKTWVQVGKLDTTGSPARALLGDVLTAGLPRTACAL